MKNFINGYFKNEDGATAIEYGLIAGGISLAIVAALFAFGDQLRGVFESMESSMADAAESVDENVAQ